MSNEQSGGPEIGIEGNGYRWNGTDWVRVPQQGEVINGYRFDGATWRPVTPEPQLTASEPQPTATKEWWRKPGPVIGVVLAVLVGGFLLIAALQGSKKPSTYSSPIQGSSAKPSSAGGGYDSTSWLPAGFQPGPGDPDLGYSYQGADGAQCPSYAQSCYKMRIVTNKVCSGGVYVAISQLDSAGNVVGRGNEITGGARPGEILLVAVTGLADAPKARVSDMSCL